MHKRQSSYLMGLISSVLIVSGCGRKASEDSTSTNPSTSALSTDTSLAGNIANSHYSEALAAAIDQESISTTLTSGESLDLTKDEQSTDTSTVTKACAADGSNAVVTLTSTVNREESKTQRGGKISIKKVHTGSSTQKRTWSRTNGTAVTCLNTTTANANLKLPEGLKLAVEFNRSRTTAITATTTKTTADWGKTYAAIGTREVTWSSNTSTSDTATYYYRNKSVKSSAKRTLSVKDKNGASTTLSLQIDTKSDAPLSIQVERKVSDNTVVSRTIQSGTMITTNTDGSIEAAFKDLKVSVTSGVCSVASGSATFTFKDVGGTTLKTYTLSVDTSTSEPILKDDAGTEVEDFAIDACDAEDLKI
ncbi:MAG: hypothetical protein NT027_15940 [Proteobacteria bacterium]|nr:hypothetical protein [Pseudomonadota bacterium]